MSPWMNCFWASRLPASPGSGPARTAGRAPVGRRRRFAWHGAPNPTQAGLGDGEGLTLAAHENVGRDPNILVVDQGVHALVLRLRPRPTWRTM